MKRISCLMTDSVNCAKVAVLCESGKIPADELAPFYENQVEFNYVPLSMLSAENAEELCVNGYSYPYYFSDKDLNLPAKRILSYMEVERDFAADTPQRALRVTHLEKNGIDMYFLTNEGEEPIQTTASVPVSGTPVYVDLWAGTYHTPAFQSKDSRTALEISLERRESLLILFAPEEVPQRAYSAPEILESLHFELTGQDSATHTKTYEAVYFAKEITGQEAFSIEAEEMVECFCNGEFVGVSFWNPHDFSIGKHLKKGENRIKLVVTGSAANRYTENLIAYGLENI